MIRLDKLSEFLILLSATSCDAILGADFDGLRRRPNTTSGALDQTTSATGAAGAGGAAGSCTPGTTMGCYDGHNGTLGVGVCVGGNATCLPDGSAYGPCEGQTLPAAEPCGSPTDLDCNGALTTCTGQTQWSKRFGDTNGGSETLSGVAVDEQLNIYLTGYFNRDIDFGPAGILSAAGTNGPSGFVAKLDPNGTPQWAKLIASENIAIEAICTDNAGNTGVTGHFASWFDAGGGETLSNGMTGIFVASFDPAGAHRFSKAFGPQLGAISVGHDVGCAPGGSVAVVGRIYGDVDFGGGSLMGSSASYDAFVVRFDKTGQHIFSKRFGEEKPQIATRIEVDSSDDLVLVGGLQGSIDLGGGPLQGRDVVETYVARLTGDDGTHLGSRYFRYTENKDPLFGPAYGVAIGPGNQLGLLTSGRAPVDFDNGPLAGDLFLVRLDDKLAGLWSKGFSFNGHFTSLEYASNGDLLVLGFVRGVIDLGGGQISTSADRYEAVVARYSAADNNLVWQRLVGGSDKQFARAMAIQHDVIVVGGDFYGTTNWGDQELHNGGSGSDIYVVKLAP